MRQRAVHLLLVLIVVSIIPACQFHYLEESPSPSEITSDDLQITPQAENSLCWDLSILGLTPTWENLKQNFQSGFLMGMSAMDISGAKEEGYQTYSVEPGQPIKVDFHLWYPEQNIYPAVIRFFVLLDEKQLSNAFPSKHYYEDVTIHPGNEVILTFNLPPLSNGVHDLIIIGIPYANDYPTPEGVVKILSHRSTLIAGSLTTPFREISFFTLPVEGWISKGDPRVPLSLTLAKDTISAWNWPEKWISTTPDTPLKFFILAGYEDVTNLDAPYINDLASSFFSLLLFVDYQQEEITPGKVAIYGKVDNNTSYARVPVETTSSTLGKHLLLILRINSPGVPMCVLQGPPGGRILPSNVTGSLVGITTLAK